MARLLCTENPSLVPTKLLFHATNVSPNFSNGAMREAGDEAVFTKICEEFGKNIPACITVYGAHNEQRLTGKHETQSIDQFSYGVSDRGASIRIPWQVAVDRKGYLEDRRPNANIDPYVVARLMVETICGAMK